MAFRAILQYKGIKTLLRLKYFLKTDKDTRNADKHEYKQLNKKLTDLYSNMNEAQKNIIQYIYSPFAIKSCLRRGNCGLYTCCFFDLEKHCKRTTACPNQQKNKIFFQARQKYLEQKNWFLIFGKNVFKSM